MLVFGRTNRLSRFSCCPVVFAPAFTDILESEPDGFRAGISDFIMIGCFREMDVVAALLGVGARLNMGFAVL